jgi:Zn finger protein HypA/HybF involved in hydrogenase expression
MPLKIRDCVECADQHYTKDMYPQEGAYICEQCFHDTFKLDESDEIKDIEVK